MLLPGIEPWTGRKTDAAITTELVPDPSQWKEKKACSVAWGGFKPFFFRPNTQNYSESGSPFPDCREGLTDRLSNSVLLPGIEPWTGRKTDAAITTELVPDPSQWKEKKACSVAWGGFKPFFFRPNTQNYSESGSPFPDCREGLTDRLSNSVLLPGIEPWTGRKTDAAITTELMPDPSQWKEKKACSVAWAGFKIHASADGLSPIADMCWRHTERKETKGTRHAFS